MIALMVLIGMVICTHVDKFYAALTATAAAALVVGLIAEVVIPPRVLADRVLGALTGGLLGFIIASMIGAQLLLPSVLLGAALLLNMTTATPRVTPA